MAKTKAKNSRAFYLRRKENGLCPRCGEEMDREGHFCSKCLAKVREYQRENRTFYRANRICYACGKNKLIGDEKRCPECVAKWYGYYRKYQENMSDEEHEKQLERYRVVNKNRRDRLASAGVCPKCGKRKIEQGKKKCRICLNYDAEHARQYRQKKGLVSEYRRENHLCVRCGGEITKPDSKICEECREKIRQARLARGKDESTRAWAAGNK